jgi:hypothetical protein
MPRWCARGRPKSAAQWVRAGRAARRRAPGSPVSVASSPVAAAAVAAVLGMNLVHADNRSRACSRRRRPPR